MLNKSIEFFSEIEKFNNARIELEFHFQGLPYSHTTLLKSLISLANPATGIIESITYNDIANLLIICSAPGRRNSGVPKKQTIRSYFRTIEQCCAEHFQIISKGQNLKIKFPTLPGIYASYFDTDNTDLYTDESTHLNTVKTIGNTNQNDVFLMNQSTGKYMDLYTDVYTAECSAKNNNIFNIKNKQQTTETTKLSIRDDFYPNAKTIELAQSRGLISVTNEAQIRKFISYNQAKGTKWVDYNPVYLNWLEQDLKRVQKELQQKEPRREQDECYSNKQSRSKPTLADVIFANQNAISPDGRLLQRDNLEGRCIEGAYGMALDQDVSNLRTAIY
ncbi:MAG: Vir protein [Legionella sp.]|nr:MAG: Vir protein [Legionella sp.]